MINLTTIIFLAVILSPLPICRDPTQGLVDFRYKASFINSYDYFYWNCFSGYCGDETQHIRTAIESRTSYPTWYQDEGYMKRHIYSDKPFELWESSCCWVYNVQGYGGWRLLTAVDLGIRSDTNKPNTSPVTTIIPIIRIPQNCASSIKLLAHDPDGDHVRCRNGYKYGECGICSWYFPIDEHTCIISVPSGKGTGSYVVELMMEDFPNKDIYLTYNDGTVIYKSTPLTRTARDTSQNWYLYNTTTEIYETEVVTESSTTTNLPMDSTRPPTLREELITEQAINHLPHLYTSDKTTAIMENPSTYMAHNLDPLSKIPLQFLVEVTSPAPSCTFGEYRPVFIPPTPSHGEKLTASVDKIFQLHLSARAAKESIIDFKVSGPAGMTKSSLGSPGANSRNIIVQWTPRTDNLGEHVPVCFVAETVNGYQSELRCVVIVVEFRNIDVLCHENTMTVIVSKLPDDVLLYHDHFRLNDPTCLVTSNRTHLVASVGYNSCGTEIEETEDSIVFRNEITSYDDISVVITRRDGVSIPFNCSFPKKNNVSGSFHAFRRIYEYAEAGFGNFTYQFQFFMDNRFVDLRQDLSEVKLRELLYVEIQVSSSVPNIGLFVESCKATPHNDPSDTIFYSIIQNGCIKDNTVVVYPVSPKKRFRFSIEAFAFIGDYEEVYINCAAILCKAGAPNTRCTRGCITGGGNKRRRSLTSESQQHFISQGPIRMKRENPDDEGVEKTSAVNLNTLVIALSGMVTVAVISVTLNIYMKRARAAGYQKLKTQEF